MSYRARINGVEHVVTVVNGNPVYDPPLSPERVLRDHENMQEMLRSQKCPSCQTDTGWASGRGTLLDQMDGDENWTKHVVRQAKKHGYSPGSNDIYLTQLARFTGDPEAFVKPSDGRARVAEVCRQRGAGCQGSVNVQPKEYTPPPPAKLSRRLTKEIMSSYRRHDMVDKSMPDTELRKLVVDKHGRQD